MILRNNTILITGGSSGIGLALAKKLIHQNNTVIICGRSEKKLERVKTAYPDIITYSCDLSRQQDCESLAHKVASIYPRCNIIINNAALVHNTSFMDDPNMIDKAITEINTNLIAPITLSKLFLPILAQNNKATIINITTGLVYAPKASYPIYNATKAGLHSFTQTLRLQLKNTPINVIEVLFPLVDTPWHKGAKLPSFAIQPNQAVSEMIQAIEKGKTEVKVGKVKLFYLISRLFPSFAIKKINANN